MPPEPQPDPWSCNPWETDGRETTACPAIQGPGWAVPSATVPAAPADERSSSDLYDALVADWPDIAPVIPSSSFVNRHDEAAKKEIIKLWQPKKLTCYWWAQYQMHVAGFQPTGKDVAAPGYYQVFTQAEEDRNLAFDDAQGKIDAAMRGTVNVERTDAALRYVRDALRAGTPVLAGIRLWGFHESPNNEGGAWTTNHFLVIVGMTPSGLAPSLIAYDYLLDPGSTATLYLTRLLRVDGINTRFTLSQIRQTL